MAEIEVGEGKGVMFEVKGKNENSPNMRGAFRASTDIKAGERIELAGWMKQTRNGNSMVSFRQQTDDWKTQQPRQETGYRRDEPDAVTFAGKDDDIPW